MAADLRRSSRSLFSANVRMNPGSRYLDRPSTTNPAQYTNAQYQRVGQRGSTPRSCHYQSWPLLRRHALLPDTATPGYGGSGKEIVSEVVRARNREAGR
eukprot:257148-Rhodomonas_salina.1